MCDVHSVEILSDTNVRHRLRKVIFVSPIMDRERNDKTAEHDKAWVSGVVSLISTLDRKYLAADLSPHLAWDPKTLCT